MPRPSGTPPARRQKKRRPVRQKDTSRRKGIPADAVRRSGPRSLDKLGGNAGIGPAFLGRRGISDARFCLRIGISVRARMPNVSRIAGKRVLKKNAAPPSAGGWNGECQIPAAPSRAAPQESPLPRAKSGAARRKPGSLFPAQPAFAEDTLTAAREAGSNASAAPPSPGNATRAPHTPGLPLTRGSTARRPANPSFPACIRSNNPAIAG